MMSARFLIAVCFAVSGIAMHAQTNTQPASPPLPSGQLLKRAPDPSRWLITYAVPPSTPGKTGSTARTASQEPGATAASRSEKEKEKKQPRRLVVTKSGNMRSIIEVGSDGKTSEVWTDGKVQVLVRPGWKEPMISTGANTDDAFKLDFSQTDFPGFEWVSASNYLTVAKVSGRDCIVFQQNPGTTANSSMASSGPEKQTSAPSTATSERVERTTGTASSSLAYVDLETRLPVTLIMNGETSTYELRDPPTAPLVFPPNVQEALNRRRERIQEATKKPRAF